MLKIYSLIIIISILYIYFKNKSEKFNDSNNIIIVNNYYTSWCGWSKKFLPEWQVFSDSVSKSTNIKAVSILCDDPDNNHKCLDVPGFPYITIEKNNVIYSYDGERKSDKMLDYINKL